MKNVERVKVIKIVEAKQGELLWCQIMIKEKSITMSISRPGKPSDNAPIETFHGYLKHLI